MWGDETDRAVLGPTDPQDQHGALDQPDGDGGETDARHDPSASRVHDPSLLLMATLASHERPRKVVPAVYTIRYKATSAGGRRLLAPRCLLVATCRTNEAWILGGLTGGQELAGIRRGSLQAVTRDLQGRREPMGTITHRARSPAARKPPSRQRNPTPSPSPAAAAPSFEDRVNTWRGACCLLITLGSLVLVLRDPKGLLFWRYSENTFAPTGTAGFALAAAFGMYLLVDMIITLAFRSRFRRSMTAVYVHHVAVGLGVAGYLHPSPPVAFFVYVWGEALTACRLLSPRLRWKARHLVFGFRRATWLYLVVRDTYSLRLLRDRWGLPIAVMAPVLCLLLLYLDHGW